MFTIDKKHDYLFVNRDASSNGVHFFIKYEPVLTEHGILIGLEGVQNLPYLSGINRKTEGKFNCYYLIRPDCVYSIRGYISESATSSTFDVFKTNIGDTPYFFDSGDERQTINWLFGSESIRKNEEGEYVFYNMKTKKDEIASAHNIFTYLDAAGCLSNNGLGKTYILSELFKECVDINGVLSTDEEALTYIYREGAKADRLAERIKATIEADVKAEEKAKETEKEK